MSDHDAVLWDIGGVIVELKSIREGYAAFVEDVSTEADLDPETALDAWKTTLGDHFKSVEGTRYRLARVGYAKATAQLFDGDPPADWESRLESAVASALRPEPGAVETITAVSERGLPQAIVSDIDTPEAHRMLDAFGVRDGFGHITTSEAVGHTKPDERMFRDALGGLEVDPDRAVMIGDRYDHDIAGAAALGIETVGYGPDARGPETDHEIDDLRELLDIVGGDR